MRVQHLPGLAILFYLLTLLTASFAWGDVAPAPASDVSVSNDKIKAVAAIYPDIFQSSQTTVTHPKTQQAQAVKLLMMSFKGATSVDELSMALKPQDTAMVKSDEEIKVILTQNNLTWEDYQQVLSAISSDSKAFDTFAANLDTVQLQKVILSRAAQEPGFITALPNGPQKTIVGQLVQKFHETGLPVAGK